MNEVQIMSHDPETNMMHPKKIFTFDKEEYKYTYVGTKLEKEKYLQIISLFPKESREFIKIDIAYDESKNQIKRIMISDKNGGTYTYLIKSFKSNTSIEPFIFNIEDFIDIEIIDLR
jgi:outer membrane lipoprotein-sorting protein